MNAVGVTPNNNKQGDVQSGGNVSNDHIDHPIQAHHPIAGGVPIESIIDHDELIDIRAYQRTFDLAYTRTALGQLSYAVIILRLFESSFYWCGLVYTILAVLLTFIGAYRYNLAVSNDDRWKNVNVQLVSSNFQQFQGDQRDGNGPPNPEHINNPLVAHTGHRSMFRPIFRTAGSVVAMATAGTLLLEIALMVLVLRL